MLNQQNVLLGVTGGIAVYKACALTSKLTQLGADVKVMMTPNATQFVSPETFQALSRNPVYIDTFTEPDPRKIAHIDVADWADTVIIAPATANIIGKLTNGVADNMLSTTLLATQAPVYVAPAMNVHMYAHPAVIRNMKQLDAWGYHFIEPGDGYLACGYVGKGRLEEPESIINAISSHQQQDQQGQSLYGKKVLVSAGPTQEKVDPVRYFTNHSSGKMGFALAEEAAQMGADVTLVAGPVNEKTTHENIKRVDVTSAEDMYQTIETHFPTSDLVIKAAAVSDYRPVNVSGEKMKKSPGNLQMEMERTTDILAALGNQKNGQYLVGFAAETEQPQDNGIAKLNKKNLDAIVVNDVGTEGTGFKNDTNAVTYINKHLITKELSLDTKKEIAKKLLQLMVQDMKDEDN